jgi:YaiO family outer membrane protein
MRIHRIALPVVLGLLITATARAGAPCDRVALPAVEARASDRGSPADLTQRVVANPEDTDARYELARTQLRAGDHAAAGAQFEILLARDPDNADWLLGRAQTLMALENPADAVPLLERARRNAPDYEDIWRAEAAALTASGQFARAREFLDSAAAQFPAAEWPRVQRGSVRERELLSEGTRASLSSSYERLSDDKGEWRTLALDVSRPLQPKLQLLLGLHAEERFGQRDWQVAAGTVHRFDGGWFAALGIDAAPGATILPRTALQLEVGRPVFDNVSVALRARQARHETVTVDVLAATADFSFPAWRAAYTLTASRPTDLEVSFGHSLRLSHDYGHASHVSLALAHGEEAETIAPGRVLVTRNDTIALMGVHWKSAAWGAAWELGWHNQGDLYQRMRVRLGLEHRF